MEVGPFRTVPASQSESGQVEVKLVDGGWEEFATIIFGQLGCSQGPVTKLTGIVDQPPGTGYSYIPTNGYLHELDQVCYAVDDVLGVWLTAKGSKHLIQFMKNFYSVFPELKGQDVS